MEISYTSSSRQGEYHPLIVVGWLMEASQRKCTVNQEVYQTGAETNVEALVKICVDHSMHFASKVAEELVYVSDSSYVAINPTYTIIYSKDLVEFGQLSSAFNLHKVAPEVPKKNPVYCLVEGQHSYSLRAMGQPGRPLIETNYSPKVVNQFRYLQKELESDNPEGGRIGLLLGQPGTGKSFLIRALLDRYSEGVAYVFVTSNQLIDLGVNLNKYLNLLDSMDDELKTVFILEDADNLLVKRQASNMSAIQNLLNMGDGLIGEALNIRLILTTNSQEVDIDPAIIRCGRLIEKIQVGLLSKEQAEQAYAHLAGRLADGRDGRRSYYESTTLAQIYHDVKEDAKALLAQTDAAAE